MTHKTQKRCGMTLVELLVVISIMMILAAVVLPQLNLGNEGHKNRESARIVSTYLSAARNKAIETGRPCGVLFERGDELVDTTGDGTPDTALTSVQMVQVQVPPPYAGDSMNARIKVTGLVGLVHVTDIQPDLIRIGDEIQLGYKGPWYEIIGRDNVNNETGAASPDNIVDPAVADEDGDTIFDVVIGLQIPSGYTGQPPTYAGTELTFQIRRQPVSTSGQTIRSMTPPQRLPLGTAVDFTASGVGNNFFADTNGSVAIMFDSNGAVRTVNGHGGMTTPIEPIYLLVGQELRVPDGTNSATGPNIDWWSDLEIEENDRLPNWQNPESRWVVIAPSTGITTVAQNMTVPQPASIVDSKTAMRSAIPEARKIAREGLDGGDRR